MGNERVPLHQQFWNTPILDQTSNHTPTTTKFDTLRSLSKPTGLPANGQRSGHKYWDVNDRVSTTKVFVEETLKLGHRVSAKFQSNCYDIGKMSCQFGSIYSLVDLPLTKKSPYTIPHDDTTIFPNISATLWESKYGVLENPPLFSRWFFPSKPSVFGDFPVPSLITRGYIPLKSIKPLSFLIIIFLWWLIYSHDIQTYSRDFPFSSTSRAYLVLLSAGSFAQIPRHGPRGVAASWAGSPRDEKSATRWSLKGLIDWKKESQIYESSRYTDLIQKTKAIRMLKTRKDEKML